MKTSGDLRVGAGTSAGCVTSGDGSVLIAGNCQSDARLKKDIRPFGPVLEQLVQLHPVYFRWKAEELPELQLGSGESFGLIAQDVEAVIPEMVTEGRGGYKAVHYSMLPLMLLQALNEQENAIARQRAADEKRLGALESENHQLRAKILVIEQFLKSATPATASMRSATPDQAGCEN